MDLLSAHWQNRSNKLQLSFISLMFCIVLYFLGTFTRADTCTLAAVFLGFPWVCSEWFPCLSAGTDNSYLLKRYFWKAHCKIQWRFRFWDLSECMSDKGANGYTWSKFSVLFSHQTCPIVAAHLKVAEKLGKVAENVYMGSYCCKTLYGNWKLFFFWLLSFSLVTMLVIW